MPNESTVERRRETVGERERVTELTGILVCVCVCVCVNPVDMCGDRGREAGWKEAESGTDVCGTSRHLYSISLKHYLSIASLYIIFL